MPCEWNVRLIEINQNKLLLRVPRNVFLQLKLGLSVQHNYWTSLELAKCLQKQFRFVEAAAFPTLCLRIIINLPLRWLLKFRAVVFAIHSRISRRRRMQYSVCLSVWLSVWQVFCVFAEYHSQINGGHLGGSSSSSRSCLSRANNSCCIWGAFEQLTEYTHIQYTHTHRQTEELP